MNKIKIDYNILSSRSAISRLSEQVVRNLNHLGIPIDSHRLQSLLSETLTNALFYGNFKIPSDYRESKGEIAYWRLVEEREKDQAFFMKKIALRIECVEELLLVTIKDGGDGFDWKGYIQEMLSRKNTVANIQELSTHGRGILLVWFRAEHLSWNKKGNEIRFSLKFKQP